MTRLIGLFEREGVYYLRIVLPLQHPLRAHYKSGKVVRSLGRCSYREAIRLGTLRRSELLWGAKHHQLPTDEARVIAQPQQETQSANDTYLRDVFDLWVKSGKKTTDSVAACERALKLYEQHTNNPPLKSLTRAAGNSFRSVLLNHPTSTKTARDRLNWIKSLLKFAEQDLEVIPKSHWVGLDIKCTTSTPRQCWTDVWLNKLLQHGIWMRGELPTDKKAGGLAAYWIPLLGIFTGARSSELCQLQACDIDTKSEIPTIRLTSDGDDQRIKTLSGHRTIPIHSELIRLGFLNYVHSIRGTSLWPDLPKRRNKAGGYFSQWFATLRLSIGIPQSIDFHSFRHTVRSTLTASGVPEPVIDKLMGHQSHGSIGAKVYTHLQDQQLANAIEIIQKIPSPKINWNQ